MVGEPGVEVNKTTFEAKFVYAHCQDDAVTVGFADDEIEVEEYILLQQSLSPTEQDKALGLDRVHISRNDQLYSAYGGIQHCTLYETRIELFLDDDTAKALGVANKLEIGFSITRSLLNDVERCLTELFQGSSTVFVSTI